MEIQDNFIKMDKSDKLHSIKMEKNVENHLSISKLEIFMHK